MNPVNRSTWLLVSFFLVAFVDILAIALSNSWLESMVKPLLMPVLMGYYLSVSSQVNRFLLSALFFSLLGDILLLDKSQYFVYGLGCFLISQLIYVALFFAAVKNGSISNWIKAIVPFALYLLILLRLLFPNLDAFFIPVLIYALAICLFGVISLMQVLENKFQAGWLLSGSVLFILSDSMIAINKFYQPFEGAGIAIMTTYVAAQFLIVQFVLRTERKEQNPI